MAIARANDLVLLLSSDKTRYVVRLVPGETFHTHRGYITHDDLIGHELGQEVLSHTGFRFAVLRPSFDELLMTVKRATQIVYPKDIGYILLKLTVQPGTKLVEAGAGSGALTCAFARYVTPGGQVYTYESRPDMLALAQANVARLALEHAVTFRQRDVVADGFEETDADAVFLDLREPWLCLDQAVAALANGGFFGTLVPTMNQLVEVARAVERRPFTDVEIAEIMLRLHKTTGERVRPMDRLTAHTGYLVFARKIVRHRHAATAEREPEPADEDLADLTDAPERGLDEDPDP
jgi:tRNA (adenine57-N1/adenine58-N1)-methyltransferase catalytic subunit